jgi:hypothetical protein
MAIVVRWMTPLGAIQSLYNLATWYEAYDECARARAQLRTRMSLHEDWMSFLENIVNARYGEDMNVGFEVNPPIKGGSTSIGYGYTRKHSNSMNDEYKKGGEIFLLGGIARMLGVSNKLSIDRVQRRWWAKLTVWCRLHMGLTTHQRERDTTRGGRPSTSYRGLDHEEPSGSEASDDDEL